MTKESLGILVEQARSFLDRQWDAFESQDRKIAGLFALSTGLITIVPTIISTFAADGTGWNVIPFALAAASYLAGLVLLWNAYRPSDVRLIGDAAAYYDEWLKFDEEEVWRWTLLDLSQAQAENQESLDVKRRQMTDAAIAVAIEAAFLFLGAILILL